MDGSLEMGALGAALPLSVVPRPLHNVLAEHWDVLEDGATQAESKSGLPMFGDAFPPM